MKTHKKLLLSAAVVAGLAFVGCGDDRPTCTAGQDPTRDNCEPATLTSQFDLNQPIQVIGQDHNYVVLPATDGGQALVIQTGGQEAQSYYRELPVNQQLTEDDVAPLQ